MNAVDDIKHARITPSIGEWVWSKTYQEQARVIEKAEKQDIVISVYTMNSVLEQRFGLEAGIEEGVRDFVRTHLKQLLVFVSKDGQAEIVAERRNCLLFNRMAAIHKTFFRKIRNFSCGTIKR